MDYDLPAGKMKTCFWTTSLNQFNHPNLSVQFSLLTGLDFLSQNEHLKTTEIKPVHR